VIGSVREGERGVIYDLGLTAGTVDATP